MKKKYSYKLAAKKHQGRGMKQKYSEKMGRKRFLAWGAGLLGAFSLGLPFFTSCRKSKKQVYVNSKKELHWKMVTAWPKNFPGLGAGAERLAKAIGNMSGGRLQIRLYAAGELVPAFEVFDTVSRGTAEMGHAAAYYWKGKTQEAQFFAAVPFGLHGMEMSAWLHYGGGQSLWDKLYANFGLKAFACGNTGAQMGGWFNRPIRAFKDFKGLKIRMPGLGGEVLGRAGATVVSLPGGEIFQALQSGAIDATEWVGPYNDLAFGFYKAAKYYYWPGWHEPGTVMELLLNKKKYDALPKELQSIIQEASKAAYQEMLSEFLAKNNGALIQLVQKHKVQLKRFSDDVLKKAGQISKGVVGDLASHSPAAVEIYKSYSTFRQSSLEWNRIGEEGFSIARMLSEKQS